MYWYAYICVYPIIHARHSFTDHVYCTHTHICNTTQTQYGRPILLPTPDEEDDDDGSSLGSFSSSSSLGYYDDDEEEEEGDEEEAGSIEGGGGEEEEKGGKAGPPMTTPVRRQKQRGEEGGGAGGGGGVDGSASPLIFQAPPSGRQVRIKIMDHLYISIPWFARTCDDNIYTPTSHPALSPHTPTHTPPPTHHKLVLDARPAVPLLLRLRAALHHAAPPPPLPILRAGK